MNYSTRRYFKIYQYEIKDTSIAVSEKGLLDFESYEIGFENISDRKVVGVYASNSAFIVFFFSLVISVLLIMADSYQAFLITAFIGIVALLYGALSRAGLISIPLMNGHTLKIPFKIRDRAEADEFADSLLQKVRAYIKAKYSRFDRNMPLEKQFEHLDYLHERNLVSTEEYEEIKNYLLGTGRQGIGFHN